MSIIIGNMGNMVEEIIKKIHQSVKNFNNSSVWVIKVFDINVFDVDYLIDKPVKLKLKDLSKNKVFLSSCFSTDSTEKRVTIKELIDIIELETGIKITYIKNLTTSHFYTYIEYDNEFEFDNKARKKLVSKSFVDTQIK